MKTPSPGTLRKYGITVDEWRVLCDSCNHTCFVCGGPFGDRPLAIDHEHVRGFNARKNKRAKAGHKIKVRVMPPSERRQYVRGVLHNHCNRYIRRWLTLERARAIVAYLEKYEGKKRGLC